MHEMSTCRQLIKQIEKFAQAEPEKKIKNIKLSVGELARVDVDELIELFPIASQGTCAENAELIVSRVSISVKCGECSKSSDVTAENMNCAFCGSENTQLSGGTDMLLNELEFV